VRRLGREARGRSAGDDGPLVGQKALWFSLGLFFSFFFNFRNTYSNNHKIHNNQIKIIYK
jgi:hypothetical protein